MAVGNAFLYPYWAAVKIPSASFVSSCMPLLLKRIVSLFATHFFILAALLSGTRFLSLLNIQNGVNWERKPYWDKFVLPLGFVSILSL